MAADPPHAADDPAGQPGEFGPGGYLPRRAADRARKIVLRERMALSWPVAALVAGVVVLGAGAALLLGGGAPGEPFRPLVALDDLPTGETARVEADSAEVLVVRVPGAVRAFLAPDQPVRWCGKTNRVEGAGAAVWQLDGRRVGGQAASLRPLPAEVHGGTLYAAPSRPQQPVPPTDRGEAPGCPTP